MPYGSIVMISGPPKCGKTAFLAGWMARLRDGKSICGVPTNKPTSLGILTTDHKWRLNQGVWFEAVGFADIPRVSLRDDKALRWRATMRANDGAEKLLTSSLEKLALSPGGVVMIDVATFFISSKVNDYNDVLAGMGTLSQVLDKFELTAIGVSHTGKQKADPKERYLRPHERILGSGAQIGYSDTTMYLLGPQDTGQPYYTFGWLPTHAVEGEFKFDRDANGLFVPYTGALHPDAPVEFPAALLTGILQLAPPPAAFKATNQLIPLIMAAADVQERRAWEILGDLVLADYLQRLPKGLYARPPVSRGTVQ